MIPGGPEDLNKSRKRFGDGRTTSQADRDTANQAVEHRALTLRSRGHSFDEIAAAMGLSREMAAKAVRHGMRRYRGECKEAVENILQLEMFRLDAMFMAVFGEACQGNKEAMNLSLKIMERRSKFLGLDAAVKAEVKTINPDDEKLKKLSDAELAKIEAMLESGEEVAGEDEEDVNYGSVR